MSSVPMSRVASAMTLMTGARGARESVGMRFCSCDFRMQQRCGRDKLLFVGDAGVGFDLDTPCGVEQRSNDDHSGGGTNEAEEFAVDAACRLPVFGPGEVHAGAVDVLDGAACVLEGCGDEGKALVGLLGDICLVRAYRAGAGDVDEVADADGAREADDRFKRAGAGDVGAGCSLRHRTTCSLVSS